MADIIETWYTASGTQVHTYTIKIAQMTTLDWPFYTKVNFGSLYETGS